MNLFSSPTRRNACRVSLAILSVVATSCGKSERSSPEAPRGPVRARLEPSTAGEGADYVYDGSGNILQIRPSVATGVAIVDFRPHLGGANQIVTVIGTGFSPIVSQNSVALNGVAAAVVSATASELTFAVPVGATTGRISVTSGQSTGTSSSDFTVVTGVMVTDFEPKLGTVGTVLTVIGVNFNPEPSGNSVQIGDGAALVTSADQMSLLATVVGATSGKITVTTGSSSGTSAEDFFVLPADYVPWDIGYTGRADLGTPATVTISDLGRAGLLLFDATQGQQLSLYVSGVTFGDTTTITLYAPDGDSVFSGTVTAVKDWKLTLPALPISGTYTIAIQPSEGDAGQLNVQVLEDVAAVLVADGDASPMALAQGQNGRYTFAANAGEQLGLACSALTTTPSGSTVSFTINRPDGTRWTNGTFSAPMSWQLAQAPVSGIYTLLIEPSGTAAVSMAFLLSLPISGTLAPDGSTTTYQTSRAGQAGRYTFAGTAGQGFTMQAIAGSTFSGTITVYQPGGSSIATSNLSGGSDVKLDPGLLPATGTYTAVVKPSGMSTGSVDVRLVAEATDTLVIGDPAKSLTLVTAQNGRYTFAADAGDLLGLGIASFATTPSGKSVRYTIYKPDGGGLASGTFSATGNWQLTALPVAGTYTLKLNPSGPTAASLTLLLSRPLTGTLATDGSTTTYQTSRAGQTGRYIFAGTAGQGFTMQAIAGSTFAGKIAVMQPNGSTVVTSSLSGGSNVKLDLGLLPASGTYTAVITPSGTSIGSVDVRLVAEANDTLVIGDPAKTLTLITAQNGRYAFAGSSGDLLTLAVASLITTPSGKTVTLTIYKPDGTAFASFSGSGNKQLSALPSTGSYTLRVVPSGATAATLAVQLVRR